MSMYVCMFYVYEAHIKMFVILILLCALTIMKCSSGL
jgi:hypothetical protein